MIATCNLCQQILTVDVPTSEGMLLQDGRIRDTAEYLQLTGLAIQHFMERHQDALEACLLPAVAEFQMFIFGKMLGGNAQFEACQREHLQRLYWMVTGRLIIENGATPATTGWPAPPASQARPS